MRNRRFFLWTAVGVLGLFIGAAALGFAQSKTAPGEKPASNLEIIHEKLKADKKLIVAQYMELTEAEAKNSGRFTKNIKRICKGPTNGFAV